MDAQANIPFPRKLFDLIEAEPDSLIRWADHGEAFFIGDQDEFCEQVLAKYFRHTKLTSFQRQLNLYGFRRQTKGPDAGAYFHPVFWRDDSSHVDGIKRVVRKGAGTAVPDGRWSAAKQAAHLQHLQHPTTASPNSPHSFPENPHRGGASLGRRRSGGATGGGRTVSSRRRKSWSAPTGHAHSDDDSDDEGIFLSDDDDDDDDEFYPSGRRRVPTASGQASYARPYLTTPAAGGDGQGGGHAAAAAAPEPPKHRYRTRGATAPPAAPPPTPPAGGARPLRCGSHDGYSNLGTVGDDAMEDDEMLGGRRRDLGSSNSSSHFYSKSAPSGGAPYGPDRGSLGAFGSGKSVPLPSPHGFPLPPSSSQSHPPSFVFGRSLSNGSTGSGGSGGGYYLHGGGGSSCSLLGGALSGGGLFDHQAAVPALGRLQAPGGGAPGGGIGASGFLQSGGASPSGACGGPGSSSEGGGLAQPLMDDPSGGIAQGIRGDAGGADGDGLLACMPLLGYGEDMHTEEPLMPPPPGAMMPGVACRDHEGLEGGGRSSHGLGLGYGDYLNGLFDFEDGPTMDPANGSSAASDHTMACGGDVAMASQPPPGLR